MNQYGIQAALRLQNILDRYEEYLLASRTSETADVHMCKLRPLFRAWDDVPMDQWTRGRFVSWLSSKRTGAKPWKPRSIQLTLTACGMFIEWCGNEGVVVPNFVDGIERPKSHRGKPIVYTREETAKLLEASRGYWLELVIALAYYAGKGPKVSLQARRIEYTLDGRETIRHDPPAAHGRRGALVPRDEPRHRSPPGSSRQGQYPPLPVAHRCMRRIQDRSCPDAVRLTQYVYQVAGTYTTTDGTTTIRFRLRRDKQAVTDWIEVSGTAQALPALIVEAAKKHLAAAKR